MTDAKPIRTTIRVIVLGVLLGVVLFAVYLGAAGVVDGRHALFCCLAGDTAGFFGAVAACHFFFG